MSTSDSPRARLNARAENPSVELELFDGRGATVKRDVGRLDVEVSAGVYELQYGTGALRRSELVSLRPGSTESRTVRISLPYAAPVGKGTRSRKQRAGVRQALEPTEPSTHATPEPDARCVVFVRSVDRAADVRDALQPLSVIDSRGGTVSALEGSGLDVVTGDGERWLAATIPLEPGGYALRYEPGRGAAAPSRDSPEVPRARRPFDQCLWMTPGWQTIVFVPSARAGVAPQFGSVHTLPLGASWLPASAGTLAVETMLLGLRDGRCSVNRRILALLRHAETANPMLGIVAAHTALLERAPDARHLGLLDELLDILVAQWPDLPDVNALLAMRALYTVRRDLRTPNEHGSVRALESVRPVTWPPMLLRGYEGLLRADAKWPSREFIVAESMAERAAVYLLAGALWTAWEPFNPSLSPDAAGKDDDIDSSGASDSTVLDDLKIGLRRLFHQPVTAGDWRHMVQQWTPRDEASIRLKGFLTEQVRRTDKDTLHAFVNGLDAAEMSIAVGLPLRLVQHTLSVLQALLPASE